MTDKTMTMAAMALAAGIALAEPAARTDFLQRQAYEEMQRVSGQVDVIQSNVDDLSARIRRLEAAKGDNETVQMEINDLNVKIAGLRTEMQSMRQSIVAELSKKIETLLKTRAPRPPAPAPASDPVGYSGPLSEYTVVSGDSLFLIARAFNTTVAKIKSINGLKGDNLRAGQKIMVPAEEGKAK